jgi:hypothetical protein
MVDDFTPLQPLSRDTSQRDPDDHQREKVVAVAAGLAFSNSSTLRGAEGEAERCIAPNTGRGKLDDAMMSSPRGCPFFPPHMQSSRTAQSSRHWPAASLAKLTHP